MPQVQRIDPIVLPGTKERVAAYCRVSTDSADQMNSYHTQIAYYTKLIADNPEWELADIYADGDVKIGLNQASLYSKAGADLVLIFCHETAQEVENEREYKSDSDLQSKRWRRQDRHHRKLRYRPGPPRKARPAGGR